MRYDTVLRGSRSESGDTDSDLRGDDQGGCERSLTTAGGEQMEILYTSDAIRSALASLFAHPATRRVAVVAYVGRRAASFLPHPEGVEVFCRPQAGATSTEGVRDLLEAGARVQFVDDLHAKVYWAEGRGAIVGSANLSNNALDGDRLHEVGVLLGQGERVWLSC